MSDHYIKKCNHDVVVEQCRCPSLGKRIITVPCPESCDERHEFESASIRTTGYLPYFDCPRCQRHRLEVTLGTKYVGENQTAAFVGPIVCEKCGWNSHDESTWPDEKSEVQ